MDCSVCLDPIRETAKVLVCGHMFCRRCIVTLIYNADSRDQYISCPECRRPSRFTESHDIRNVFVRALAVNGDASLTGETRLAHASDRAANRARSTESTSHVRTLKMRLEEANRELNKTENQIHALRHGIKTQRARSRWNNPTVHFWLSVLTLFILWMIFGEKRRQAPGVGVDSSVDCASKLNDFALAFEKGHCKL